MPGPRTLAIPKSNQGVCVLGHSRITDVPRNLAISVPVGGEILNCVPVLFDVLLPRASAPWALPQTTLIAPTNKFMGFLSGQVPLRCDAWYRYRTWRHGKLDSLECLTTMKHSCLISTAVAAAFTWNYYMQNFLTISTYRIKISLIWSSLLFNKWVHGLRAHIFSTNKETASPYDKVLAVSSCKNPSNGIKHSDINCPIIHHKVWASFDDICYRSPKPRSYQKPCATPYTWRFQFDVCFVMGK